MAISSVMCFHLVIPRSATKHEFCEMSSAVWILITSITTNQDPSSVHVAALIRKAEDYSATSRVSQVLTRVRPAGNSGLEWPDGISTDDQLAIARNNEHSAKTGTPAQFAVQYHAAALVSRGYL